METNILAYAFIGDAVYSQFVRALIVRNNLEKIYALHKKANAFVNAKSQACSYDKIKDAFTEQESIIANRARNAKTNSIPKNASLEEYKKSTSLEAVFGYNFLNDNNKRNEELFNLIIKGE